MPTPTDHVLDLVFGRWRSQTLYAGVELSVFDHIDRSLSKTAAEIAKETKLDPVHLYRLLRAHACLGLVAENEAHGFVLTDAGALLRSDHPQSLKSLARLEEGPQHYAIWKHLPDMIRDGTQNAFLREFGQMAFDHALQNPDYDERFKHAMSSYSAVQSALVAEAMRGIDLTGIRLLCDVAGGHGHLLCTLLQAYPQLSGIVLDLPDVMADKQELWAGKLDLEHRCRYVGGDMFEGVPAADAYVLKMILHDWNDEECASILSNIHRAAAGRARIFIVEHVVPAHDVQHFSKLFDIHMMCWGNGRERTESQYSRLLHDSGWEFVGCHYPSNRLIGVVEAVRT